MSELDKVFNQFLGSYEAIDDDSESGVVEYKYFKEHLNSWDYKAKEVRELKQAIETLIKEARIDLLSRIHCCDNEPDAGYNNAIDVCRGSHTQLLAELKSSVYSASGTGEANERKGEVI